MKPVNSSLVDDLINVCGVTLLVLHQNVSQKVEVGAFAEAEQRISLVLHLLVRGKIAKTAALAEAEQSSAPLAEAK